MIGINEFDMSAQSFQYDPLGRRVSKTILETKTNHLYDGASLVQEPTTIGSPRAAAHQAGALTVNCGRSTHSILIPASF